MANITGIKGFNSETISALIAAYGNDVVNVDTGKGYSLNLNPSYKVEFEVFLDYLFLQNFNATPVTFDGLNWGRTNVARTPKAKYIKEFGSRVYLGYVEINGTNFPSRVIYSDLPKNNTIQWGIEWGTNGACTAGTSRFTSANSGFSTYGIKVGDPLMITSGANIGEYTVSEIVSDMDIRVEETFKATATSQSFWVGSNWFDVRTDNNDFITWITENNDRLLIFKQDSLHRYDGSALRTIKDAPGTTSGRSVVNLRGVSVYYHKGVADRSGFYACDGTKSVKLSNSIQPYIDGISDSMSSEVVGWREGNTYRAYVGDITNDDHDISISKAVVSYDFGIDAWSIDPISDTITCATEIREANTQRVILGNSESQALLTPSGYDHNGEPIHWSAETSAIYPRGLTTMNIFTKAIITAKKAGGINVSYLLWDSPAEIDDNWHPLGDLEHDRTEFLIPTRHANAFGISYRFEEAGKTNPNFRIESVTTVSYPQRTNIPEIRKTI
jgi:hypothetical protein